jgi:nucleoside-diphosphate-sugar epimerase
MVISIIGCGWFGLQVAKSLIQEGHPVKGSTTSIGKLAILEKENIEPFLINLSGAEPSSIDPSFFHTDILLITIPPKVKHNPGNQYIAVIQSIIELIKKYQVKKVIYISSTGVYGNCNSHVDESTSPVPDSLSGKVLLQAESLFRSDHSFTTTVVRFGGLIGPGRDPANFFSGKKNIPNGRAPVNLIHLEDCCGICLAILNHHAFGYVINACAPEHPKKMDFYTQSSIQAGMQVPEFVDELLNWKIVNSMYVQPLLSYKFSFSMTDVN